VLDDALALIEERGHLDFTLREVARRVGVSHAAPYRHFADKRALVTAIAAEALVKMGDRLEAALAGAGSDLRARMLAAGYAYVLFAVESPSAFRVIFSGEFDDADPAYLAAKDRGFGLLLGYIGDAQRAGVFPPGDPLDLARSIWAMHHGFASLAVAGAFKGEGREGLRRILDAAHGRLFDGITRRA
jgi:AcrR family transcriptional regulator